MDRKCKNYNDDGDDDDDDIVDNGDAIDDNLDDVDVDDDDVCVLHLDEEELLHLLQLRSLLPRPLPLLVSNLQHFDFY